MESAPSYSRQCNLYPIIYSDKRFQVSDDYVQYMFICSALNYASNNHPDAVYKQIVQEVVKQQVCPDLMMATKIALHKSDEWAREAEWRLFCTSNDADFQNAKHGYCIKKPTALYLGRRISEINEKVLILIAKEKYIPVYKMQLDDASPSYKMLAEAID